MKDRSDATHELDPPFVVRVELHDGKPKAERSQLTAVLNSTVLAALVTTLVGGIAAQCVVQRYQAAERANERSLAAEKERSAAQRAAFEEASELLADARFHGIEIYSLTLPAFDVRNTEKENQAKLAEQREKITNEYNAFSSGWLRRKQLADIHLSYEFGGNPQILAAWDAAVRAAETFIARANAEYALYRKNVAFYSADPNALTKERLAIEKANRAFASAVEAARRSREGEVTRLP